MEIQAPLAESRFLLSHGGGLSGIVHCKMLVGVDPAHGAEHFHRLPETSQSMRQLGGIDAVDGIRRVQHEEEKMSILRLPHFVYKRLAMTMASAVRHVDLTSNQFGHTRDSAPAAASPPAVAVLDAAEGDNRRFGSERRVVTLKSSPAPSQSEVVTMGVCR